MAERRQIIVIGAGVIGLCCALRLKQAGFQVTVVARNLPGDLDIDYASPWAGAHFRLVPVTTGAEALDRKLSEESYEYFQHIQSLHPDTGITFCPAFEYFEDPPKVYTDLDPEHRYCTWHGFRVLEKVELPLAATWGVSYDAWVVDSPAFLLWLQRQLGNETRVIRAKLQSPDDALRAVRDETGDQSLTPVAVVNASGTGMNDQASFISRGQFLVVDNPCDHTISYHFANGSSNVVVPRFGSSGTVIGGSKEPREYDPDPNRDTTDWILDSIGKLCPNLAGDSGLRVRRTIVGRRPMRKGGLRVELDAPGSATGGPEAREAANSAAVVHCYGAGGSGFKVCWGAAGIVLDLVQQLVK